MSLEDFAPFVAVPVLLIPLASVYLSLRWPRWNQTSLFVGAFVIWLVGLTSGAASWFAIGILTNISGLYWKIPPWWWALLLAISMFTGSFSAGWAVVSFMRRKACQNVIDFADNHFDKVPTNSPEQPSALKVSLVTTFAGTGTLLIACALAQLGSVLYEHHHPQPNDEFHVYEISRVNLRSQFVTSSLRCQNGTSIKS